LLRFPAVHGQKVVFSYGGNLYTVARSGGVARRLTDHEGYEMFPKYSHDGTKIAYTGQYDGNTEIYIIPAEGGPAKRITYTATLNRDDIGDRMGPNNIVLDWTPDDQQVVYRSRQHSFNSFKGKLYLAPISGDISEQMPFSVGGWCSYNEDGSKMAMNHTFREFRTWKYYRGGMAPDIHLFDFKSGTSQKLVDNPAQDAFPMMHGNKVFFLSDRDRTMNLFEYDLGTKQTKKITSFTNYDIKFPSLCKDAIAFEQAGFIHIYDIPSGKLEKLNVIIADDFSDRRGQWTEVHDAVDSYSPSPSGKRIAFGARGEVMTVPAKEGFTRNLTQSSGAHDRNVEWSPDGKTIAFISDRTGEEELYIQKSDGSEAAKALTSGGGSYKYNPLWSPDGKKILQSTKALDLYYIDVASGKKTEVFQSGAWELRDFTWSPDSRWIAYIRPDNRTHNELWLYSLDQKKHFQVTEGWYSARSPEFDPEGKYLYFVSGRDFNPTYSNTEWNHSYSDMTKPYLVTLQKDLASPFIYKNDEVEIKEEETAEASKDKEEKKEEEKKEEEEDKGIQIDTDGMLNRIIALPVGAGTYWGMYAVNGGLYYYFNKSGQGRSKVKYFDFKSEEESNIGSFSTFYPTWDKKKVLVGKGGSYYMENLPKGELKPKNKVDLSGMKIMVNRQEEWAQIFHESWRQMRDFFYDENMHGVDWPAVKKKYEVLLPFVNHRNDLTYIIGEMIGELNVGHAYVLPGDRPEVDKIKMGLLGARYQRDKSGYYQITDIIDGANWSKRWRSPLREVGVEVNEGDYLLAINGVSTKDMKNLFEAMIGTAGQIIELTVNSTPSMNGSRTELVKPIADEAQLYYYEWVHDNIKKVDEASNGEIGYLHIPDMGPNGLNQFARYFYPQIDKKALIIDDRGNGGGNVSPMIIERLRRELAFGATWRNSKEPSTRPAQIHLGPKVALVDRYSASDGDLFAYQFKHYNIGPLIGERTWGGVVGIRGSLPFVDGGSLNKPEFSHYAIDGKGFVIEGFGVEPDMEVYNDPHNEFNGQDRQLQTAIEYLKKEIKKANTDVPPIPAYPDKSK